MFTFILSELARSITLPVYVSLITHLRVSDEPALVFKKNSSNGTSREIGEAGTSTPTSA